MELTQWQPLKQLLQVAGGFEHMQVWLFGSALLRALPGDIDVLLVYEDRSSVIAVRRAMLFFEDYWPPCHIIAMTSSEVAEYDFVSTTGAVRLL